MNYPSQNPLVFLSYSRVDKEMMFQVRNELEKRGLSVWTDEGLVPGTDSWKTKIEEAIQQSQGLVVLLSPDAKKSIWVEREIDFTRVQGRKIYPLLGKGEPQDSIPIELINSQWVDIREKSEIDNQLDKLAGTILQDIEQRKDESESLSDFEQTKSSGDLVSRTDKTPRKTIPSFLKDNGRVIGIVVGIIAVFAIILQFVDSPSIQAMFRSPTWTPSTTATIIPSQTPTITPIPNTLTPTYTESPIPSETMTPSLTATIQPSPTIEMFPGQDWLDSCIDSELWGPFGDPEISPDRENGCWALENLGLKAQTGDLLLRKDIGDPTNRANTIGIYTGIPSEADTVRFNILVNSINTKEKFDAFVMMGFVPIGSDGKVEDWKNGRFLYVLVGTEDGNPLLMRGEPDEDYHYVELPTKGIFNEEYQVKLTLIDGSFSIYINGTIQRGAISFPYFQYGFWIGYQLRDGGSINAKILDLCFESSSGDFSTCTNK